jgi:hypothetical protein
LFTKNRRNCANERNRKAFIISPNALRRKCWQCVGVLVHKNERRLPALVGAEATRRLDTESY